MTKHGGCHDCKSQDQEVLKSVKNPLNPMLGKAICDKCLEKGSAK